MRTLLANWLESPLFVPIMILCVVFGGLVIARQFLGNGSNHPNGDSDGYK